MRARTPNPEDARMTKSKSNAASALVQPAPAAPASASRLGKRAGLLPKYAGRAGAGGKKPVAEPVDELEGPVAEAEAVDVDEDAAPASTPDPTVLAEPEIESLDEEFDLGDAVAAELEAVEPVKPPVEKRHDEGGGDSMLARYFREMATHHVMGPQEELATAIEVEQAEVDHWVAIFSCIAVARAALDSLERDLPTGEEALTLPQIAEMRKVLHAAAKNHDKLSRLQEKKWLTLTTSLARAIRLADSDRLWVAHAEDVARGLGRAPDEEAEEVDPEDPTAKIPLSRATPVLPPTPQLRKYEKLLTTTLTRSKAAKNKFVKANLRLVVSIARRYNRGRLPLIDLIQEGNIGLMKAVERFDHTRGYRFSTYASWWIRHAISRALADKGRAVRIPVHMLDTHNRVARATQAVIARLGRDPTLEELEHETGIPQEKLDKVKGSWAETPFSLDRPVGDEDGRKFIDFLQDDNMLSPYETLVSQKWNAEVRRLLGTLTPIESRIIRWRFGLDDEEELTLKEIGDKYNLSRERIRQLQEQALGKIRKHMRD
jgi:RNA polymerase primary sigma factor